MAASRNAPDADLRRVDSVLVGVGAEPACRCVWVGAGARAVNGRDAVVSAERHGAPGPQPTRTASAAVIGGGGGGQEDPVAVHLTQAGPGEDVNKNITPGPDER